MHFCSLRPNFLSLSTTLTLVFLRSWPLRASNWSSGTTARGSITDPNSRYRSSFAIDGDTGTFWNDDTNGEQSDILTIEVSSSIALDGIILLSNTGGWVLSYTVETLHGSNWIVDATVVDNNESSLQYVPFAHSVHNVTQLRIVVTKVQIERYKYIRINEVYSIMARANSSNISTSRPTLECSNALKIPSIDSSHCQTDFNIVAIVGGVLGLFILILSIVVLLLLRKLKQLSAYVSQFIEHSSMEVAEASFVPAELSISNGRVSYRKSELDSRGSHQRSELDSR